LRAHGPDLARQLAANPGSTKRTRVIVRFSRTGVNAGTLAAACGGDLKARHKVFEGATVSIPRTPC